MANDAKNQRQAAEGRFTRKLNEFIKSIDEGKEPEIVERNFTELSETWKSVKTKHDVYSTFLSDDSFIRSVRPWNGIIIIIIIIII